MKNNNFVYFCTRQLKGILYEKRIINSSAELKKRKLCVSVKRNREHHEQTKSINCRNRLLRKKVRGSRLENK